MNVSIIGSGNMAKGIGMQLLRGGHSVQIHGHEDEKAQALVEELSQTSEAAKVTFVEKGGEVADIVILAVPYQAIETVANDYGGFAGKTVIDITNPVDFTTFELIPEPGKAGAEHVAKLLPNAKVVKAFNTTLAGVLQAGEISGQKLDVFIASSDEQAKAQVVSLVESSNMRPLDVGGLVEARHLEGFGLIQMKLQDQLNSNWMSALKFIN